MGCLKKLFEVEELGERLYMFLDVESQYMWWCERDVP